MTDSAFVAVYEMDFSREDFAERLFEVVEMGTAEYNCGVLVEGIIPKAVFQVFIYFQILESSGFGEANQLWKWCKVDFMLSVYLFQKVV